MAPGGGTPAQVASNSTKSKRHAEEVLRTLTDMGFPPDRVRLSSITNSHAVTNEVHLYIR